jgi:phosphoribosylformylglycinamidine (FGAM) synthase PurS component
MPNRIEVAMMPGGPDPAGEAVRARLHEDLHIDVASVRVIAVYTIDATLSAEDLERVREELFTDPIIQVSALNHALAQDFDFIVEVGFRPGVTDNVGRSARGGVQDVLGRALGEHEGVYTAKQYVLRGIDRATAERAAKGMLANELIEQWVVKSAEELRALDGAPLLGLPVVTEQSDVTVHPINLEVDDDALMALSRDMMLALDLREMRAIQAHYRDPATKAARAELGLPEGPNDIELEVFAQTWSEHCKHKIFAAQIEYTDETGATRTIDGLFKTYVKGTTDAVRPKVDWLVSVFDDNAGIINFDDDHLFALKAETHNSPSALDPYGGAMTGIVGVNRDILGAGMGCRCIFNTDVFCFASPFHDGDIPERLLHPRRVLRGVHRGVKDGGNESGIPTVNGAIVFHERFLGKPLVFCGTGGLMPRPSPASPATRRPRAPATASSWPAAASARTASTARPSRPKSCTRDRPPRPCRSATPSPRRRCTTSFSKRATSDSSPASPTTARAACPPVSAKWPRTAGGCRDPPRQAPRSSTTASRPGKSSSPRRRSA